MPCPAGQNSAPEQPISRAQLCDDPSLVCQLDCKEATGVNSTWKKMLDPPYQVANYLRRLPLGTKVGFHVGSSVVGCCIGKLPYAVQSQPPCMVAVPCAVHRR
jgi:hypothetical protein